MTQRALNRGSIWRKWDLHVHIPGTKLNNRYKGTSQEDSRDWDTFCQIIHESDVDVFGITDYFTLLTFFDFKDAYNSRYPQDKKVFFPNLELRAPIAINDSLKEVNFHIIFHNDLEIDQARLFMSQLKTQIPLNESNYHSLMSLQDRGSTFFESVTVDFDAAINAIDSTFPGNRHDHAVIAVSGNDDGLSPGKTYNPRKGSQIDNIDYKTDIIFSNSTNAAYWSNPEKRASDSSQPLRPHPTFYGCDAHDFETLRKALGKSGKDQHRSWETTWVKADPTWNGLLQTLVEPDSRVKIQKTNPDRKPDYLVIDSVSFRDHDTFPEKICFNPGLNAIIGSRSSGKSALLAHLAYSIDPERTIELQSMTDGTPPGPAAGFTWEDIESDYCSVRWRAQGTDGRVVYIPQNFLNNLGQKPDEVTDRIRPAIWNRSPELKSLYSERSNEIATVQSKIDQAVGKWFTKKREQEIAKEELANFPSEESFQEQILHLDKEIAGLQASSNLSEEDLKRYEDLEREISNLESASKILEIERGSLDAMRNQSSSNSFVSPSQIRVDIDLTPHSTSIRKEAVEEVQQIASRHKTQIEKEVETLLTSLFSKNDTELASTRKTSETLKEDGKELFERISLNTELRNMQKASKKEKDQFQLLLAKQEEFNSLTAAVRTISEQIRDLIAKRGQLEDDLCHEFNRDLPPNPKLEFRLELGWDDDLIDSFTESFSKRPKSEFIVDGKLDIHTIQSDPGKFLESVYNQTTKIKKDVSAEVISRSVLKQGRTFRFAATMDDDTIGGFQDSTMTPGKQALFALTIILSDAGGDWPLLIDQPEDDLDSKSIYQEVVDFLKKQKQHRQIIMVTHNANLVVGADAELVLVANRQGDDRPNEGKTTFDYLSGSLEDTKHDPDSTYDLDRYDIREHAMGILDGGPEAFKKRMQKYRI